MLKSLYATTIVTGLLLVAPYSLAAPHDESVSTPVDQKEVAVTIYNHNLALIKDARRVKLTRDFNKLAWRGVSAQMRPETAQLRNLTSPAGFRLQEQNFDFDLLTPEKLLESVRSPILHRGHELQIGFSIGISLYPEDGRTAAELMARADHAMYEAKDAGRNSFRFSSGKASPTSPTPL